MYMMYIIFFILASQYSIAPLFTRDCLFLKMLEFNIY